jgi:hypothetical protein
VRGCVGDSLQITCPRRNKHPFASYVAAHPKEVLRYRAVGARGACCNRVQTPVTNQCRSTDLSPEDRHPLQDGSGR